MLINISFSSKFCRKVKAGTQQTMGSEGRDGSLPDHRGINGSQNESKLELFGFDSLVNILGLKRYGRNDRYFLYEKS